MFNLFSKKKDGETSVPSFFNVFKHSPQNNQESADIGKKLDEGKTVTMSSPMSQRFTFSKVLAKDGPVRKDFKPETEEQKQTLSPNGFFMGDKVGEKREELKDTYVQRAKDKYKANGQRFTKGREQEAITDAENERLYEADIPSTAIKTAKYDPKTESLWVTFTEGNKKYFYPRVPKDIIEKWASAGSKGQFFLQNIHDQYTLNPGHSSKENQKKNQNIHNYYKKMQKYYRNVRTKGHM